MNHCTRWTSRAFQNRPFSKDRFVKNKYITWANVMYSKTHKYMAGSERLLGNQKGIELEGRQDP